MGNYNNKWAPFSWRFYPASQQPEYENTCDYNHALTKLSQYPQIVQAEEIDRLSFLLAKAQKKSFFIFQVGDCAEQLKDSKIQVIRKKVSFIHRLAQLIEKETGRSVLRIGRIAGQYAKPRSSSYELCNNVKLASFKGENINSFVASHQLRKARAKRLQMGYFAAYKAYQNIKLLSASMPKHQRIYTSHEGLVLSLEAALTRYHSKKKAYYNLSAHMLWVGERTRALNNAHMEYFRGIKNPIGLKIGPHVNITELIDILKSLNPENFEGKISLIFRLGKDHIQDILPTLVSRINKERLNVLWLCDPMHGNTFSTKNGIKTRLFDDIVSELQLSFKVLHLYDQTLNGIHLELTHERVTECLGGMSEKICEQDLALRYKSLCDPRLNFSQGFDLTNILVKSMKESQNLFCYKDHLKMASFSRQISPLKSSINKSFSSSSRI